MAEQLSTGGPVQTTFADLGTPLSLAEFVVVDLETTGGAPGGAGITEIGAVAVRGGEVIGEFQTLVNPGTPIPAFIAALTGITDAAVSSAPGVLPAVAALLEFIRGRVFVAHNAPYDVGFLRGACAKFDLEWPDPVVLDTAKISRATLLRDEVPNHKLATLARHVRAKVRPTHRALDDARATVDVLHYLIERVGDLGVLSVEELATFGRGVTREQRRKRTLADGLPDTPGVYVFLDDGGNPLYVGTSGNIKKRVQTYFTASEKRTRMAEMVRIAAKVQAIECSTALEAEIRESRLIGQRKPPYNRRSKFPERDTWIRLTREAFPRPSIVRRPGSDADAANTYVGPFPSRRAAQSAVEAITEVFSLRTCTPRLPVVPRGSACAAAELGRCPAPCDGSIDRAGYAQIVQAAENALRSDFLVVDDALRSLMASLSRSQEYEKARQWRDRLQTLASGVERADVFATLAACAHLVAARPTKQGGWEIHVVRHGRLAGAGVSRPKQDPRAAVQLVCDTAEHVEPVGMICPPASTTEVLALWRWLQSPGVRLVQLDGELSSRSRGASRVVAQLRAASKAEPTLDPSPIGSPSAAPGSRRRAPSLRRHPPRLHQVTATQP